MAYPVPAKSPYVSFGGKALVVACVRLNNEVGVTIQYGLFSHNPAASDPNKPWVPVINDGHSTSYTEKGFKDKVDAAGGVRQFIEASMPAMKAAAIAYFGGNPVPTPTPTPTPDPTKPLAQQVQEMLEQAVKFARDPTGQTPPFPVLE